MVLLSATLYYMADLISLTEAAAEFGVHRTTLHRYIRAGRLQSYHRGLDHRTYLDRDELRHLTTPRPAQSEEK